MKGNPGEGRTSGKKEHDMLKEREGVDVGKRGEAGGERGGPCGPRRGLHQCHPQSVGKPWVGF